MVELHSANGYLFTQFQFRDKRSQDEYGGGFRKSRPLSTEVIRQSARKLAMIFICKPKSARWNTTMRSFWENLGIHWKTPSKSVSGLKKLERMPFSRLDEHILHPLNWLVTSFEDARAGMILRFLVEFIPFVTTYCLLSVPASNFSHFL